MSESTDLLPLQCSSPVVVDAASAHEGAYGPTIRVDIQARQDLIAVRRLFARLTNGESVEEEFCHALACASEGVESLTLRVVPGRPAKALEPTGEGSEGRMFRWVKTAEDWEECVAKLDGLLEKDAPGHQYLTREGVDDALVELCYKEEWFG